MVLGGLPCGKGGSRVLLAQRVAAPLRFASARQDLEL